MKLAASLTTATGLPYDSQHLPITTLRYVKNDGSIQFEINVPKDAVIPGEKKVKEATSTDAAQQNDEAAEDEPQQVGGRGGVGFAPAPGRNQKQLAFEYELAANKLVLLDEPPARKPAWASISPDGKSIVFTRNYNLYIMDEANYAKALKDANDKSIAETEITKDGEEYFGYGGRGAGAGQQDQQQQQDNNGEQQNEEQVRRQRSAANISWSKDSKKFSVVRSDQRKVKPLWVINSLSNPRPTLETTSTPCPAMPTIRRPISRSSTLPVRHGRK